MKREYLEGLGLEKEAIDSIMAENGKDIEVAKKEVEGLELANKNLTEQLETANKEIEGFKELNIEDIKLKADKYKEDFELLEKQSKEEIEKLKYEHALADFISEYEFASERVKNSILEDLKEKEFKLIDNAFLGADEYMEKLKEKEPNSFAVEKVEEQKLPKFVLPGSKNKTEIMSKEEFLKLSYSERTEMREKNESLYKKIMN